MGLMQADLRYPYHTTYFYPKQCELKLDAEWFVDMNKIAGSNLCLDTGLDPPCMQGSTRFRHIHACTK